jgi:hypothetical protein
MNNSRHEEAEMTSARLKPYDKIFDELIENDPKYGKLLGKIKSAFL